MELKQIPKNIQRIYILGGPGSGKTYIANILSKQLKITLTRPSRRVNGMEKCAHPRTEVRGLCRHFFIKPFDLDDIAFEIKYTKRRSEEECAKILKRICSEKRWIIEGAYTSPWVHDALQKSDIIILLDFPITTTIYRIILREIHRPQKTN